MSWREITRLLIGTKSSFMLTRDMRMSTRGYNEKSCSAVVAVISGNKYGMIGERDILVRKRGQANSNGNEVLDKLSISQR